MEGRRSVHGQRGSEYGPRARSESDAFIRFARREEAHHIQEVTTNFGEIRCADKYDG